MTALTLERIVADALAAVQLQPDVGRARARKTAWCSEQPGFGVRHYASGRCVYLVQARMHGVLRTVTLCHEALIGRRAAMDLARRILLRAQVGQDPAAQRSLTRSSPTFAQFLDRYWVRAARGWKLATLLTNDKYRRLYLDGAFSGRGIDEIADEEVVRWFAAITAKGSPGAANRTLSILSALFNKAIEWGRRPAGTNPARAVRRNRSRVVERHLSNAELSRLGVALAQARGERPLHAAAVLLLLLTGCRHQEIIGLQWAEARGGRLLLTDSKTGPRTVWLGDEAKAVLSALPRHSGVLDVFYDQAKGARIGLSHFWQTVRATAQLGSLRLHDLRHTFASHAAARSEPLPMIGKLLGHAKIASTARYAHLDDSHLSEAAEQVGARLLELTQEQRPKTAGDAQ